MAFVMLAVMVLAVLGFAFLISGGSGLNPQNSQTDNVPFGQFQHPETQETFWAAIINGEYFYFLDIEGFDENTELREKARILRSEDFWQIYIHESYIGSNGPFLIEEKMRNAFGTISTRINETPTCETPTIVFTSQRNTTYTNKCVALYFEEGEDERTASNLAYFLVQ